MKREICYVLLYVILTASHCAKREGENCHYTVTIKNNSKDTVIFARLAHDYHASCSMGKIATIPPGENYKYGPYRGCWEDNVYGDHKLEDIYILESPLADTSHRYYDCDSIPFKYKILKPYVLTLDDLQGAKFTITYP